MFPTELKSKVITLPETDDHSIVLVTGNDFRHRRFAYRLQKEFGDLVQVWYELDKDIPVKYVAAGAGSKQAAKPVELAKRKIRDEETAKKLAESHNKSQAKLFAEEIEDLKAYARLKPVGINPKDVLTEGFKDEVLKYNPYFFLTLGGPLYRKPLLESIRGAAINQHAGHSPDFKGTNTTEWALYHRNLFCVSSTVHITITGADAGPILRRSNPCIFHKDSFTNVFARIVALGTELMIEVVQDIIKDKNIIAFEQSQTAGKTYLDQQFDKEMIESIERDFDNNWLEEELIRQHKF